MRRTLYSYAKSVLPITREEFSSALNACRPPTGWSESIAVSNSGGPDSTCLLYLLKRHVDDPPSCPEHADSPQRVVSISIDHQLQPASKAMAEQAAKLAESMNVEHINKSITWSTGEFPDLPVTGAEGMARLARYSLLHAAMSQSRSQIVAFGHHLDDQVETAMMRLAKGSRAQGAAGMKPLRRWGMGVAEKYRDIGWTGAAGMNHWIIRPLLGFPKDRLLATCDANGLQYAVDKTNFMPSYTFRNTIRAFLQSGYSDVATYAEKFDVPLEFRVDLQRARDMLLASAKLEQDASNDDLRSAVTAMGAKARDIDRQVDELLPVCMSPLSPIGTYIIDMDSPFPGLPNDLKFQVITRILRYVSPHPWGSLHSTNKYRLESLFRITSHFERPFDIPSFVAGSAVRWRPVLIREDNHIRILNREALKKLAAGHEPPENQRLGWLAVRQPPPTTKDNPTNMDLTKRIREYLDDKPKDSVMQVVYDCRFLVRVDLSQVPEDVAEILRDKTGLYRIMIRSADRYWTPHVVSERNGKDPRVLYSLPRRAADHTEQLPQQTQERARSSWISMEWIRQLNG